MFGNLIRDATKNMVINSFWIITGLETTILGLIILHASVRLDEHTPIFFDRADTQGFAAVMTFIGVLMIVSFLLDLKFCYIRTIFASISTTIWSYISISFLLSDMVAKAGAVGVLTCFSGFIALRIIFEAWLEPAARMRGDI